MTVMARSERQPLDSSKLKAALIDTQKRLEVVDAIEDPIERSSKRDQLLELHDWLQEEIASSPSE